MSKTKSAAVRSRSAATGNGHAQKPKTNDVAFSFSDTVSGYVTDFDWERDRFQLRTSDGRQFELTLTEVTAAEVLRNTTEPYDDCTATMRELLAEERFVTAYGVIYPEPDGNVFEAKHLIFYGREKDQYRFEEPDWWVRQLRDIARFYLRAEFGDEGPIDFAGYRT